MASIKLSGVLFRSPLGSLKLHSSKFISSLSSSHPRSLFRSFSSSSSSHNASASTPSPIPSASTSSDHAYFESRMEHIQQMEAVSGTHAAYPPHSSLAADTSVADFRQKFESIAPGARLEGQIFTVAGRIILKRQSSNKLTFYTIQSNGINLQVMATERHYDGGAAAFERSNESLKRGDILVVRGFPGKTNTGELSIIPHEMKLLSPCLHNLPHYHGLEDSEVRHRNRHLDMIVNERVRKTFIARAKTISFLRNFLDSRGFIEVETPTLNTTTGGANARPFETHLRALDMDMKLRISPELFLKRCVIGGLERVYEVGKQFRNEGVDYSHNPEFTTCELYQAYADYDSLFSLTEEMLSGMAIAVTGSTEIPLKLRGSHAAAADGEETEVIVSFKPPFKRVHFVPHIESITGEKLPDFNNPESIPSLVSYCKRHKVPIDAPFTLTRLLDDLASHFIEPECIQPTFLCDHPLALSPLAKEHRSQPGVTERFELFIGGKEICNAYTELNDPREQRRRFGTQVKEREMGDVEAQEFDESFCKALEYGLPPTAGWGIGIDRLCMLLTGAQHIRDVILFPTLRPEQQPQASKPAEESKKVESK